jgi:hypothetical protein
VERQAIELEKLLFRRRKGANAEAEQAEIAPVPVD